jgi:hypothetical protein
MPKVPVMRPLSGPDVRDGPRLDPGQPTLSRRLTWIEPTSNGFPNQHFGAEIIS